jgi:alanine racemase
VLASYEAASLLSSIAVSKGRVVKCHIFINVGDNRMCYNTQTDMQDIVRSSLLPGIDVVGIMAHFACASNLDVTREQLALFLQQAATVEDALSVACGRPVKLLRHTANTQATLSLPESHLDMVRIGGGLFGQEDNVKPLGLRPAFAWTTCVSLVRRVPAGTSVGYGMAFTLSSGTIVVRPLPPSPLSHPLR